MLQCPLSVRGDRDIAGRAVRVVVAAEGDGALQRNSDTGTVPAGTLGCSGAGWGLTPVGRSRWSSSGMFLTAIGRLGLATNSPSDTVMAPRSLWGERGTR